MQDQRNYFFETRGWATSYFLGAPKDYIDQMVEKAYEIGDHMNQETNLKGIMSTYHVWNQTDLFNPLFDKISEIVSLEYKQPMVLHNAWTGIYKSDHHAQAHHHCPSGHSFVYYIKATIEDSPLVLGNNKFEIKPQTDLLIHFPALVEHLVPRQTNQSERVVIAGNLVPYDVDGQYIPEQIRKSN